MKKSLTVLAVMVAVQLGWAAHRPGIRPEPRPGIVLRMTGELVSKNYTGPREEFRLMSNGTKLFGFCQGRPVTCDLNEIGRMSPSEMRRIGQSITQASRFAPVGWVSGAMCLRAPDFQNVYTAANGTVLLKNGDICLSGGMVNPSKAAKKLMLFIQQELPLKLH